MYNLEPERTLSELIKPFFKKNEIKNQKKTENQGQNAACEQQTTKITVKLPHVNKTACEPLARKLIFVQIPFSHSTLKLERKNFTPQNHSLFRSTSRFGVTKITKTT